MTIDNRKRTHTFVKLEPLLAVGRLQHDVDRPHGVLGRLVARREETLLRELEGHALCVRETKSTKHRRNVMAMFCDREVKSKRENE